MADRNVIFEFVQRGHAVRVAAVDVITGIEVVIQGPANAARHDLERVAYNKLMRALGLDEDPKNEQPRPAGRGWIV